MKRRGKKKDEDPGVGRSALQSIVRDAHRARLGDRLPEDRRPGGFVVSIGLNPERQQEDEEDEEQQV